MGSAKKKKSVAKDEKKFSFFKVIKGREINYIGYDGSAGCLVVSYNIFPPHSGKVITNYGVTSDVAKKIVASDSMASVIKELVK